jgi:hypothetical protein
MMNKEKLSPQKTEIFKKLNNIKSKNRMYLFIIKCNRIGIEHENCKIIYIDMGDQFKELHIPKDPMAVWSTANFYRVKLQDLLMNEHKII